MSEEELQKALEIQRERSKKIKALVDELRDFEKHANDLINQKEEDCFDFPMNYFVKIRRLLSRDRES